jgi:hypothetical protein
MRQAITSASATLTWELGGGPATSQSCELDGQPIACSGTSITVSGLSYDIHTLGVSVTGVGVCDPSHQPLGGARAKGLPGVRIRDPKQLFCIHPAMEAFSDEQPSLVLLVPV